MAMVPRGSCAIGRGQRKVGNGVLRRRPPGQSPAVSYGSVTNRPRDHWAMAATRMPAHRAQMEIILLLCTGLAFLALVAAVPIDLDEERRSERDRRLRPR